MGSVLYTIGYAAYPDIGAFIAELKKYGVSTLIDIRRRPYRALYDQYEEDNLRNTLTREDLAYIRFEDDFGMGSEEDDENGPESPLDFEETAKTEGFIKGITRLRFGVEKGLIPAVMGETADPAVCPRGLLIARALHEMGYTVRHIAPGGVEEHDELEKRIIEFAREDIGAGEAGDCQMSLIPASDTDVSSMSDEELLEEGYRRLNRMLF